MSAVTEAQAYGALNAVAEWMGTKGYGGWACPEGRPLDVALTHIDDDTPCTHGHATPAPTGPEAAYRGEGPELRANWDWTDRPVPYAIILEGGPDDWAIECAFPVQKALKAAGCDVFVEPITSFALGVYAP